MSYDYALKCLGHMPPGRAVQQSDLTEDLFDPTKKPMDDFDQPDRSGSNEFLSGL